MLSKDRMHVINPGAWYYSRFAVIYTGNDAKDVLGRKNKVKVPVVKYFKL